MAHLAVEGAKQIYYEHHDGRGMPIVLVHGWAVDSRCWDGVLPALLDAGHAVITLDHRCCGRSDRDFADVSISAIAGDVVRVTEHLGMERVVLNGWSLGGAVVVAAAAALGKRLAGLVLTGGATPRYTRSDDFEHGGTAADVAATIAGISADRANAFEGVARAVFAADPGTPVLTSVARMFLDSSPRAYATLLDLAGLDQRGTLPKISAPVLLLHGDADAFVPPAIAAVAAAMLPNARLSMFPQCGHAPFMEDTPRYIRELTDFLKAPGGRKQ